MSESPDERQELDADHREHGNSEAAKWRRKLRDTEAERDRYASRLAEIQRGSVETLLVGESVAFDALEATGATLTNLLDAEGQVDPDKVRGAAQHARNVLGIDRHAGLFVPAEGRIPPAPAGSTFSAAFAPRDKR
jgi:hypothetical protein